MTDMTPLEPTSLEPMSLETALAKHNAARPDSPLVDITDALDRAKAARLLTLLHSRLVKQSCLSSEVEAALNYFDPSAGSTDPRQCLCGLIVFAGIILTSGSEQEASWPEMEAVLNAGGAGGTPAVQRRLRRSARAQRFINRLVMTGCIQRGEVARIK